MKKLFSAVVLLFVVWMIWAQDIKATVNVKNYGATGNGSTDDTAAINNAIAALTRGATLLFPCGNYLVTSQLTINVSNITVDGSNCAVIRNTASGTVMVIGAGGNVSPNYVPAVALSATAKELDTRFTTDSSIGVTAVDTVRTPTGGLECMPDAVGDTSVN